MDHRTRKVEAWSTDQMYVYECDSCQWIVQASPDAYWVEIESEFDVHDCEEKPLGRLAAAR
jgi:hypothetical protein